MDTHKQTDIYFPSFFSHFNTPTMYLRALRRNLRDTARGYTSVSKYACPSWSVLRRDMLRYD